MAIELYSPGATYIPGARLAPPVLDGLVGCYLLGGSLARSVVNHAPGGQDAQVVGSPVVNAASLTLTGLSAYLETDLPDTDAAFMMAVGRMTAVATGSGDSFIVAGNYSAYANQTGQSLYFGNATLGVRYSAIYEVSGAGQVVTVSAATPAADTVNWRVISGGQRPLVGAANGAMRVNDWTAETASTSNITAPRILSPNALRIGSGYSGYAASGEVSHVLIYDRLLVADEIETNEAWLTAMAEARGLTLG